MEANMQIVSILLETARYNFDQFIASFEKKWQIPFEPYIDEGSVGIITDGMVIGCALYNVPVADTALVSDARENIFWPEAETSVLKHKAHLRVAVTREGDPVACHILFTKVIYSLLGQNGVLGVYLRPGYIEPSYYLKCAENLTAKKLPTELWVHIYVRGFEKDEGYSFKTAGLEKFGKKEIEITETKINLIDDYYNLREQVRKTIINSQNS